MWARLPVLLRPRNGVPPARCRRGLSGSEEMVAASVAVTQGVSPFFFRRRDPIDIHTRRLEAGISRERLHERIQQVAHRV